MNCEKCGKPTTLMHSYIRGLHERHIYKCANNHKTIKKGKVIEKKYW